MSGLEEFGIVDDENGPISTPPEIPREEPPIEEPTTAATRIALEQVSLFSGLLPAHLERIAALSRQARYKRGAHVFRHGDDGDALYLVLEGAIRISRNLSGMGEEALAILRPGHYFGEMCIVDDEAPRSADAIVHEEARLLRLPKDEVRDLMFVDRELAYELLWRFVRTLSGRLRESNDRLIMLSASSKF